MLENLEELQKKVKKMEQANEIVIQKILDTDEGELSKKKEELVSEFESENDKYLEEAKNIQGQLEGLVEKAEDIVAGAGQEPVHNQGRQATDTAGQTAAASAVQTSTNTDFRPHSNLKPNYLEKSYSHLEVKTLCEHTFGQDIEVFHHRVPRVSGSTSRLACT